MLGEERVAVDLEFFQGAEADGRVEFLGVAVLGEQGVEPLFDVLGVERAFLVYVFGDQVGFVGGRELGGGGGFGVVEEGWGVLFAAVDDDGLGFEADFVGRGGAEVFLHGFRGRGGSGVGVLG